MSEEDLKATEGEAAQEERDIGDLGEREIGEVRAGVRRAVEGSSVKSKPPENGLTMPITRATLFSKIFPSDDRK